MKARLSASVTITVSILAATSSLSASPVQLLSAPAPSVTRPAGGNGDSVAPWISSDGRYVVFSSSANDLVTNGNGQFRLNVFLYDQASNAMTLVSANASGNGGGNGDSLAGRVSSNGQYVVFQSDASDLLAGDTNGVSDIFVRDLQAGATLLVSVAADGSWANGASSEAVMTPDGRWVAFVSAASNLVSGDTNRAPDLFVRDLVSGTTKRVSLRSAGTNVVVTTPVITPDGRYVAFVSTATNMVPGIPAVTNGEIYLGDLVLNQLTWASTNAAATVSNILSLNNAPSSHPALSDDGRYVAFKTGWTDGNTPTFSSAASAVIVFVYDAVAGTNTILSTNGYAPWANSDDVYGPEMTSDGRFVAFLQREPVLLTTNYSSIRLWDRQTGTNVLVSANIDGLLPTNSTSHTPAVSQDGRYVTFLSSATNLTGIPTATNVLHIYRRDLQTGTTVLMDVTTNGTPSTDQTGAIPSLSADGQYAVYAADDGGLVGSDNNNASDIFLWDAASGTNVLISRHNPLASFQSGNLASSLGPLSLSGNGGLVAFASYASDLVANDTNGVADVFVRDLAANSNILVSMGLNGNIARGGGSYNPVLSADGRYVTFTSGATNLVAGDINATVDVFRRNLQTGAHELVSLILATVNPISSGANPGTYDAAFPASSQDGRYIAFLCRTNTSTALTGLFWRDMNSSLTRVISGSAANQAVTVSADGQRVAYFDSSLRLYVWDANLQANIYTNTTAGLSSAALSPAGNRLLYLAANQLFVYDLATSSNLFLCPGAAPIKGSSPWSGDGRYVAFVTGTNLVAGDNNAANDVYLLDLQTRTLTLVSINQTGTGSAAGSSDSPVVSTDGRFVAFRSFAANILPGIVSPPSLVVFDRSTGANSLLATGTTGTGWTTWLSRPVLNTNGTRLAFQSWDSGLVNSDLNRAGDIFAGDVNGLSLLDSDGDGIPDWWMMQYFGHPTGQAGDLSRAQDDADGDDVNNLGEYLAGTIPTNPDSALALHVAMSASGTSGSLNWGTIPGRNYQVLSTTNLSNPAWLVFPGNATVIGNQGSFNIQAADSQRYFRIQCGN